MEFEYVLNIKMGPNGVTNWNELIQALVNTAARVDLGSFFEPGEIESVRLHNGRIVGHTETRLKV